MAMDGINPDEIWEPYVYNGKVHFRVRHDDERSARAVAYRNCVGNALRGTRFRGGTAAEDEAAVRNAFRQAAKSCSIEDKAYPSDATK